MDQDDEQTLSTLLVSGGCPMKLVYGGYSTVLVYGCSNTCRNSTISKITLILIVTSYSSSLLLVLPAVIPFQSGQLLAVAMEVSPSSRKVDDFLSSVSQLSQDRLKEDQQRQRELRRDIDELRARLSSSSPAKLGSGADLGLFSASKSRVREVPQLVFNRNPRLHTADIPPPMPSRPQEESPPPMPARPESPPPPALPLRRNVDVDIQLMRPVAKTAPPKPSKLSSSKGFDWSDNGPETGAKYQYNGGIGAGKGYNWAENEPKSQYGANDSKFSAKSPYNWTENEPKSVSAGGFNSKTKFGSIMNPTEKQYGSFAAMESKIKQSEAQSDTQIKQSNTQTKQPETKPVAPLKPAKSDWLSSTILKSNVSSGPYVPKPSYFSAISAAQAAKSQGAATSMTPSKPQPQPKPSSSINLSKPTSSPGRPLSPNKPTSWLDSVVQKTPGHDAYSDPNKRNFTINKPADKDDDNKLTWLDSIAQKETRHEYIEAKPSFQIPKKPASLSSKKTFENEEPELVSHLSKFKAEAKKPVPPKPLAKPQIELKTAPPKPAKLEKKQDEELLKSHLGRLSPTKTLAHTKQEFAAQDNELLKQQLSKLGSKTSFVKPSTTNYKEQDNELLRSQLSKLGSKPTKLPPQKEKDEAEGLLALSKLKPAKAPPQKVPEKPEALRRLEALKKGPEKEPKKAPPKPIKQLNDTQEKSGSQSDLTAAPASFHDQLSSILKSSTAPALGAPSMAPVNRSKTDPSLSKRKDTAGGKLTHPNKARAKGPRRKLPKSIAKSTETTTSSPGPVATPLVKKRLPPPIKAKPNLDQLKPSRNFSGELFI